MLVLEGKQGDIFYIGNASVEILGYSHGKVKLGFTADPGIPIDRAIVRERKRAERDGDSYRPDEEDRSCSP